MNGAVSEETIRNDIEDFKTKALDSYNKNINTLGDIFETEDLIKTLFNFKLDAIGRYNEIFKKHPDTFNNSEYLSWYNDAKREIEEKMDNMELSKLDENNTKASNICKEVLEKEYERIQHKIDNNLYTSKNCEEYLKDYERFLTTYNEEGKGDNKLKIFIEFISDKKVDFIKAFTNNLNSENKAKMDELAKKLEQSNQLKQKAEDDFRNLNDKTEENSKKVKYYFIFFRLMT